MADSTQIMCTDRAQGVLVGLAVGDALGVPYEFGTPPAVGDTAWMRGGGLGPYRPGEWSDDTQMAICIAEVALSGRPLTEESSLDALAERLVSWLMNGASDVGHHTRRVLQESQGMPGGMAARMRAVAQRLHQQTGRTAGNGALMRTAPVALTALHDRHATALAAQRVAELTHADPVAAESCVLWTEAIRVAVTEHRLDIRAGLDLIPPDSATRWAAWILGAERPDAAQHLTGNGYTVTAFQAAWHAISTTSSVPDALNAAIRIGTDTDTVAAIAGSLLGGYWGFGALPALWRDAVHGWPGLRAADLAHYGAVLAASSGRQLR